MAYEIIPEYKWVEVHPLYTVNNKGFLVINSCWILEGTKIPQTAFFRRAG